MKTIGYNYKRDKKAWVSFDNGKPKQKLRNYISKIARILAKHGNMNFGEYKSFLVSGYDKGGIPQVKEDFQKVIDEIFAKIEADKKKVEEIKAIAEKKKADELEEMLDKTEK